MKNIPEDEIFDQLKDRLKNYSENPDDDLWNKIAPGTTHAKAPGKFSLVSFTVGFLTAIMFSMFWINRHDLLTPDATDEKTSVLKKDSNQNRELPATQMKPRSGTTQRYQNKHADITRPGVPERANANSRSADPKDANSMADQFMSKTLLAEDQLSWQVSDQGAGSSEETSVANGDIITMQNALADSTTRVKEEVLATDSSSLPDQKAKLNKLLPDPVNRGIKFYATITPLLSYQRIMPAANDHVTITKYLSPGVLSAERLGISIEAGLQGSIAKQWEYYAGLSYYQQRQTFVYQYQSGDSSSISRSDNPLIFTIEPGKTYEQRVEYQVRNLGVQAGVLRLLKGNKLTTKVGIGFSYQLGLEKSGEGMNSHPNYLFAQVLYRNELALNNVLTVFLQPDFHYALNSHENTGPFSVKPYRTGIGFGMVYRLQKRPED